MLLLSVMFMVTMTLLFLCQEVEASKQCWPDGEYHRYDAKEILDVADDRFVARPRIETNLFDGDR